MAGFLVKSFRVSALSVLSNSVGSRLSLSTQIPSEETTDEILNQILAAEEDSPSSSREELCVGYIRKLCAAGDFMVAARIPRFLRNKHIFVGPRVYSYILEAAERKNDIDMLTHVFKDLLVSCESVGSDSYLVVARGFGKQNSRGMLLNFIREVCEMDLPRIDIVLNRIIYALGKCGNPDGALLVFEDMKSSGCRPDLITYNTVLAILGRLGRVDDMLRVFASMRAVGLAPDIFTYNTILNSLRKMGRLDLCMVHFREMTERGILPDLLTFKALIESLGRSGNIDEALKIFEEMKYRQIRPLIPIYRALIFSLKKMGKMELALKFSNEMNDLIRGSVVPRGS
ncbi:pentatricopeptide repeat-containing protein At1g11900 [Salvia miltiorrhiza]|uniref:pentatricopeptide repeat-containing protein At1g11900 n=1 Tax=Salvia miltiorrhiza TaxID=226208 RepID=UPI0025AC193F|nr:pentatricopeptide repeat-containing protein At1g11900 [Salvia miltiorrhiza]XP_057792528.1 pentatricopeptide repeat-containing protein At1g11900 [Salvia miltiorrhiza]XP_057792529.1 pentatricopeptide repeat-containing protein At1g11900 [Salvia miltiorrhiza]